LALTGVLGIGEGHLFHHRKARRLVSGDFAKSGSLFQDFPSWSHWYQAIASNAFGIGLCSHTGSLSMSYGNTYTGWTVPTVAAS
ncbi:hypothetical protein, partial [Pseudomonas shirazica]|uniref:hypothetical protein n=1 Tax=Pseudomonas shirazica TaxID=1940636 RepID=UPI003AADFEF6